MLENTEYSQRGANHCKTIFLFCCPGRHEKGYMPVNGPTGNNLDMALSILHEQKAYKKYFPCHRKSHYHITNAWPKPEYMGMTHRTQPSKTEVLHKDNLDRLSKDLRDMDLIIACGQRAKWAIQALKEQKKLNSLVVETLHLSPRAINRWIRGETIEERISQWVQGVLSEIKKKQF